MELDPVKDRLEFERRINSICDWTIYFTEKEILSALVDNNEKKLEEIRVVKKKCEEHMNKHLKSYDEAPNEKERAEVVGSVTKLTM